MAAKKKGKKSGTRKKSKVVRIKLSPKMASEVRDVLKRARNEIQQKRKQLSIKF